ncbi:MAG: hypothetical protein HUJ51_03060 [Eggerthellaceae bacterium]|nr:hypothetical protein [Eggerthellaceae bacterium]
MYFLRYEFASANARRSFGEYEKLDLFDATVHVGRYCTHTDSLDNLDYTYSAY